MAQTEENLQAEIDRLTQELVEVSEALLHRVTNETLALRSENRELRNRLSQVTALLHRYRRSTGHEDCFALGAGPLAGSDERCPCCLAADALLKP